MGTTLKQFIEKQHITVKAKRTTANPNMDDQEWARTANHWTVTLRRGRKRFMVPFSQGSAITKEPDAADVLDCLANDASSVENAEGDFEEWCSEYGYDTDSRMAEKTYRICEQQAKRLKAFLGDDLYKELLWEIERN